ncbi:TIGR03111 family XrtG-associated glycosyltransferase [uncultured Clostridium sp.]|uniref:TIGR03111 family XrtG-associated glycosyltransferase n=1 Tax=uncultured Clostridium sp. TaxID=59620 RepID=UPI0028E4427F|nr:TIGR03111 family XrtG-associated glycosyltransferase [uncultured Clostridium sp.]
MINNKLFQQFIFWGVWLVIPLTCELIIGIISAIICFINGLKGKQRVQALEYSPRVSILVPIYNSENTLSKCLESILYQTYPLDSMEVILIDNGSNDNSYDIFTKFQSENPKLKLWWINSLQGKAKALNKGIFCSTGKYIINIDSDGWLDKNAVQNVIVKFEQNTDVACMTGVILTEPALISKTSKIFLKIIQICEYFEYMESFLIGRNFYSEFNSMYTLAGAFSCFRREILLKTSMYNFSTVGEDTHMTFQIRTIFKQNISLCDDAFFYVDPIESLNKLYTQRQRWQRGQIEVASLYKDYHIGNFAKFIKNPFMRILISDHTLVFPRLIWFFGMIYLYYINYPLSLLISSNILIYVAYTFNSFVYLNVAKLFLRNQPEAKEYVSHNFFICLILPIYRFLVYWMRLAGIINSTTQSANWKTQNFTQEIKIAKNRIKEIMGLFYPAWKYISDILNNEK